jgi:hypothetical protein
MGKQKRDARAPVSPRALIARINRRLAHQGEKLIATKGERHRHELGDFYAVDLNRNAIVHKA